MSTDAMTRTPVSNERLAQFIRFHIDIRDVDGGKDHDRAWWADLVNALTELQSLRSSPSCGSGVKKLEWEWKQNASAWFADSVLGPYQVFYEGTKVWWSNGNVQFAVEEKPDVTLEEAKAAAQADFDQRIRSALEPAEDEPVAFDISEIEAILDETFHFASTSMGAQDNINHVLEILRARPLFTRPASLEITDELIERAAKAIYDTDDVWSSEFPFDAKAQFDKDTYLTFARAALTSALGGKE